MTIEDTIRDRLEMNKAIRRDHVTRCGVFTSGETHDNWGRFSVGDGEASFHDESDAQYYERLTGHIEELEYLLKALK